MRKTLQHAQRRNKHCHGNVGVFSRLLQPLLQQVYHGMSDENIDVRNAAMFALGQFAVHLQVIFFLQIAYSLSTARQHISAVVPMLLNFRN